MSNCGLSTAAPICERKPPTDKTCVLSTRRWVLTTLVYGSSYVWKGTTAGRVVSPCSIMVQHGFRGKEVRHTRKQNIDYATQHHTPHCWLPAMSMYPANSTKRLCSLTRSNQIFIDVERSNIFNALNIKIHPHHKHKHIIMYFIFTFIL